MEVLQNHRTSYNQMNGPPAIHRFEGYATHYLAAARSHFSHRLATTSETHYACLKLSGGALQAFIGLQDKLLPQTPANEFEDEEHSRLNTRASRPLLRPLDTPASWSTGGGHFVFFKVLLTNPHQYSLLQLSAAKPLHSQAAGILPLDLHFPSPTEFIMWAEAS